MVKFSPFNILYGLFRHHCIKKPAIMFCHTKQFYNFVLVQHQPHSFVSMIMLRPQNK